MTTQEAINMMKYRINTAIKIAGKGEDGNALEDMEMAVQALEKQIPKKPDYIADGYADGLLCYDYAQCPICGHDFEYGINDWECDYCSDCGQKLDWK